LHFESNQEVLCIASESVQNVEVFPQEHFRAATTLAKLLEALPLCMGAPRRIALKA
jgi:hypothetical protein